MASTYNTPKSPEVGKFEKKLRKKDDRQDQSIKRLNQQMQDMIREAQQALGSRVEVVEDLDQDLESDSGGEGYVPDAEQEEVRW